MRFIVKLKCIKICVFYFTGSNIIPQFISSKKSRFYDFVKSNCYSILRLYDFKRKYLMKIYFDFTILGKIFYKIVARPVVTCWSAVTSGY